MRFKFKQSYTDRQMVLIGLFSLKVKVTIDEMVDAMERKTNKKVSRQGITSIIKAMANKLALDGYVMKRTSKLGRGSVGEYILLTLKGEMK